MAAPVAAKITLPTDAGNAGPILQTQTELIAAEARHVHFFVSRSKRKILGNYKVGSSLQSVVNTAHDGVATGFVWLQLPAASGVHARLRHLQYAFTCVTETDMVTAPRIVLARFTFTGTASGTEASPALRMTGDAAAIAHWRTAVTGMTVTVGNPVWSTVVPTYSLTTSGIAWAAGPVAEWKPTDEEDFVDIAPGEGLLIYQPDTGTAADGRRLTISGCWDEYDSA